MATQTVNLPYDTSTVANYKSIMTQFGTALSAFGWVQTADTGQVTWSGVSTLPGNGVFRDWEIWRMNDTAQSTNPVFVKLEYSTQGTNAPQIRITIGSSSNGSGTITGTILQSALAITGANSTSLGAGNNYACYYSGASGRLMFLMWEGAAVASGTTPWTISIERSKDSSGNDTDEFVVFSTIGYINVNPPSFSKAMTKTGVVTAQMNYLFAFVPQSTANFNSTTGACPQFIMVGKLSNPLLGYAFVPSGDAGEGATINVNIYGASHTYIACKANGGNGSFFQGTWGGGATYNTCVLCRYE